MLEDAWRRINHGYCGILACRKFRCCYFVGGYFYLDARLLLEALPPSDGLRSGLLEHH